MFYGELGELTLRGEGGGSCGGGTRGMSTLCYDLINCHSCNLAFFFHSVHSEEFNLYLGNLVTQL